MIFLVLINGTDDEEMESYYSVESGETSNHVCTWKQNWLWAFFSIVANHSDVNVVGKFTRIMASWVNFIDNYVIAAFIII